MNQMGGVDRRAQLLSRAAEHQSHEPGFARFLRAAVEATDPEDLAPRPADAVEAAFRAAYGRLGKRELAAHNIYVIAPEKPGDPEIVEVFSADMPFIVDSVLAAIRARGGVVRLFSHPPVQFDPATYRVLDGPLPGSRIESFLHVEIEPLADAVQRELLHGEIDDTLTDVGRAVAGWRPMLERVRTAMADWHAQAPKAPPAEIAEATHFLQWLLDDNLTFLGMREYRLEGGTLVPLRESGLGVLEDPKVMFLRSGAALVEMTEQHRAFLAEPAPLLVTKANIRSRVHRRAYMDYVGVKLYDAAGEISGELRIVGLFTSMSLNTPNIEVPLIRRKVSEVLKRAGHDLGNGLGQMRQGGVSGAMPAADRGDLKEQRFQFGDALRALLHVILQRLI